MDEQDLIIGKDASPEEDEEDGPIKDEDIVWDETVAHEYVDSAINVLANLESIDKVMMNKEDQRRVKQMQRWALRIAHHYLKEIYEDLVEEKSDDDD